MRFLLFIGEIESLRHFSSELSEQIKQQGHEACIIDLTTPWADTLAEVIKQKVDAVICYDGDGIMGPIGEIYDKLLSDVPVINILMDHPMVRVVKPPKKFIQLSPDENHVAYSKRFAGVENAFFLPHMASLAGTEPHEVPMEKKTISVLMPGSLGSCNAIYQEIKELWWEDNMQLLVLGTLEYLLDHPDKTVEDALQLYTADCGISLPDDMIVKLMDGLKRVELFLRMYFRNRVVSTIISAGIPITLVGGGWNSLAGTQKSNVTILPSCSFAEVFSYMQQAKITLNVMPWFKAGTHDRIFNALMHYSCPLTDESSWLLEHFTPEEECAYYSIEHLDELPGKVYNLLMNPEKMRHIVHRGREKVLNQYTSRHILDMILEYLEQCYITK